MILFASLVALAFSGCGDYSDCSSCTSSSSNTCNWVVSRLRRNLGTTCVDARRQLTETESRRNLATYTVTSECPAVACTDYSDCVDCAQNECEWVVSSRRSLVDILSKRRNLGSSCADPHGRRQLATEYYIDYSECPAAACTDNSDCTSCAQNGCEWTEGRRNLGADSYASSSGSCADVTVSSDSSYGDRRRKLASASPGITDYSYCPAEEAVVTEAPEPLEERWWFVMMLVIVIGIFVWIGVGFLIYSGEVDKHESDWGHEKQKTMDFSHAHEEHGHDDHGHGDHGAGGHGDHGAGDHGHDSHHGHDDPHGHNSHGNSHGHDDHGKRGPHAPHGHHDPHGHNSHGRDSRGHNNHGTQHGGHANHGHSRGYDREYITE